MMQPDPIIRKEEEDVVVVMMDSETKDRTSKKQQQQQYCELQFEDNVDLQTRLVLLPYNDSDCVGAIVGSYNPTKEAEQNRDSEELPVTPISNSNSNSNKITSSSSEERRESVASSIASKLMEDYHNTPKQHDPVNNCLMEEEEEETILTIPNNDKKDHDENSTSTTVSTSVSLSDDNSQTNLPPKDLNIEGSLLVGIQGISDQSQQDWAHMEYTHILSLLRDAPTPIVLTFSINHNSQFHSNHSLPNKQTQPQEEGENSTITSDCSSSDSSSTMIIQEEQEPNSKQQNISSNNQHPKSASELRGRLSAWGSRVAAEAQKRAEKALLEIKTNHNTTITTSKSTSSSAISTKQQQQQQQQQKDESSSSSVPSQIDIKTLPSNEFCTMFLQTHNGQYIPLQPKNHDNTAQHKQSTHKKKSNTATSTFTSLLSSSPNKRNSNSHNKQNKYTVTNSSILSIRQPSGDSCPITTKHNKYGYSFQWYRSNYLFHHDGTAASQKDWILLEGATYASFQPSANDIGYTVKCVVTIPSKQNNNDDHDDPDNSVVECPLPCHIEADTSLLNLARQSFIPGGGVVSSFGACFGGFVGTGEKSQQKKFKIHLEISQANGCILSIVLLSGKSMMLCHDPKEPILYVTAIASPSMSRELELIFRDDLPSSAMLLSSFCDDDHHKLKLQAPSRVVRESFLLAMGVANFNGNPNDLNPQTILYPKSPSHMTPIILKEQEEHGIIPAMDINDNHHESKSIAPDDDNSCESIVSESLTSKASDETLNTAEVSPTTTTVTTTTNDISMNQAEEKKMQALELAIQNDLRILRDKLGAKDRIVYELQQRLIQSDSNLKHAQKEINHTKQELERSKSESREHRHKLRLSQNRIENHETEIMRLKRDLNTQHATIDKNSIEQRERELEYMKTVKALENEKAVLSAAVEARGTKLSKMEDLKKDLFFAQKEVTQGRLVKKQLEEMTCNFNEVREDLNKKEESEKMIKDELGSVKAELAALKEELMTEKKQSKKYRVEMEKNRMKCQKFKGERNTMKQKADSLAKEMSRICRNGRGIAEIEKIINDTESRKMEVQILTAQKRKVVEELEVYKAAFETSLRAHEKTNVAGEAILALDQKAELERMLSDLTEYVNAKEMQLETLKEVNQSLSEELQAKLHCEKDEV